MVKLLGHGKHCTLALPNEAPEGLGMLCMDQLDQGNTASMVKLTPDDGAAERKTQQFLPVI